MIRIALNIYKASGQAHFIWILLLSRLIHQVRALQPRPGQSIRTIISF